jgi:hypothetical protein
LASLLLFACLASARPTLAQGAAAPAPTEPTSAGSECTVARGSAISELSCELRRALPKVPAGTLVVSAPLAGESKSTEPAQLTARLASVVAGALGAKSHSEPATLSRARSLAASSGTLLHLSPDLSQGELRVTADLYPVPRNFWDRVRDPEPSPKAHAFASRRLDAELRTFLPAVPLIAQRIEKASSSEPNPLALACGDVNGDGALELVLVGRSRVQVGRVRAGRLLAFGTAAWAQLSPLSHAPLREPIASVWIEPGRFVDVGLTDRVDAVRLDGAFTSTQKLGRRLPWPGGGCAKVVATSIRPEIERCSASDAPPETARMDRPADAVAGAVITTRAGAVRHVRAERFFNEAVALIKDDAGRSVKLEPVGAQLAIGDLDGDGQPEILSSADTLDPSGDALVVHTWQDDGKLVERYRLAVAGGVRALAVCPPESSELGAVALASSGEVWVIR